MAPLTDCIKNGSFKWTRAVERAFETIKSKLCSTLILALPNFELPFQVECDGSGVGIGAVLNQAKWTLACFNDRLGGLKLNYSTYDKEFHIIIWTLNY